MLFCLEIFWWNLIFGEHVYYMVGIVSSIAVLFKTKDNSCGLLFLVKIAEVNLQ